MEQKEIENFIPDLVWNLSAEHSFILGHLIKEERIGTTDIRMLKVVKFSNHKKLPMHEFLLSLVLPNSYGKLDNVVNVKVYREDLIIVPKGQCEQYQNLYIILPVGGEGWSVEALKNTKLFSFLMSMQAQNKVQDEMLRRMMGLLERASGMMMQIENNNQARELAREIAMAIQQPVGGHSETVKKQVPQ